MTRSPRILVATHREVLLVNPEMGEVLPVDPLEGRRPTQIAWDPRIPERAWCGTTTDGVLKSEDGGRSWLPWGLQGSHVMAVTPSRARENLIWAGTEPSEVWRTDDAGLAWKKAPDLTALPSSGEWAFPPRPETHHVRWIACHPRKEDHLWVAVEAGALVRTTDGGATWLDRVEGGPRDTHELALHPWRPETLRVAGGDGYFESHDGGRSWIRPLDGLDVTYLRSVAIDPGDPEVVLVSASTGPRSAYVAGRSDGRLYRREGQGPWKRILEGWPDPPDTIAPLLRPGVRDGEMWAADERGVHRSRDGGRSWTRTAAFQRKPDHLRGFSLDHGSVAASGR